MFRCLLGLLVLASTLQASSAAASIRFQKSGLGKCLHGQNGAVVIHDCDGSAGQKWILKPETGTKVQLDGTNSCLSASSNPKNGEQLIIVECTNEGRGSLMQQWYMHDNRLVLENQIFCVDLYRGITTNSNKVQTWECKDNNPNQIWTLG